MGTGSYVLAGTELSEERAFSSACHGAGRSMSRRQAYKTWRGRQVIDELAARGIIVRSPTGRGVAEEAPGAYKDVGAVVDAAAKAGLAGCGIEDTRLPDVKPYEFSDAVERIEVAVEASRSLEADFVLTARADGLMNGQYDYSEALRRAKAFEAAGADVIYIPLLREVDQVAEVCREINTPVNVLCAGKLVSHSLNEFAGAGVARVSLGSMLSRVTHQAILEASRNMFGKGDFSSLMNAAQGSEVDALLKKGARSD